MADSALRLSLLQSVVILIPFKHFIQIKKRQRIEKKMSTIEKKEKFKSFTQSVRIPKYLLFDIRMANKRYEDAKQKVPAVQQIPTKSPTDGENKEHQNKKESVNCERKSCK